jgi:Ca-activated chloride channel homolog
MKSVLSAGLLILAAAQAPTFRTGTDAVTVDVLAMNGNRPIGGLTPPDFELRDNGVVQRIADVEIRDVPFSMVLALDTSSSVTGRPLRDLQEAARAAIARLHADDRASLITFSETFGGEPAWASRPDITLRAVTATQAIGYTGLYDAVFVALMHPDREPGRRRLIVLFTDGHDTISWLPARAVLDAASRTDAVVYVVTVERPEPELLLQRRPGTRVAGGPVIDSTAFLPELVERTGGDLLVERSSERLQRSFERIITEFRSRYVLTYRPENVAPDGWHALEVKLKGRKGAITARRGYQR